MRAQCKDSPSTCVSSVGATADDRPVFDTVGVQVLVAVWMNVLLIFYCRVHHLLADRSIVLLTCEKLRHFVQMVCPHLAITATSCKNNALSE